MISKAKGMSRRRRRKNIYIRLVGEFREDMVEGGGREGEGGGVRGTKGDEVSKKEVDRKNVRNTFAKLENIHSSVRVDG